MGQLQISVVAPVYNGANTVAEFINRTWNTLQTLGLTFEILLIDDGSTDDSVPVIKQVIKQYPGTKIIKLAGNFGQSNALAAGLQLAKGKFCVVMDSDLQDKPEDIPALYHELVNTKLDMVIASRSQANTSALRNLASMAFYTASNLFTTIRNPHCAGVFRVIRCACLQPVLVKPYRPGTILSQLHARGCPWKTIPLERERRTYNKSGYTIGKLLTLSLTRLLVFGKLPVYKIGKAGIALAILAFVAGVKRQNNWNKLLAVLLMVASVTLKSKILLNCFRPRFKIQAIITE